MSDATPRATASQIATCGDTPSGAFGDVIESRSAVEHRPSSALALTETGDFHVESKCAAVEAAEWPQRLPHEAPPCAELPSVGLVTDRDANGRFLPGNTAAMTHGARRSLDAPDLAAAVEDERQSLVAHVGGAEALTPTLDRLVRSTARVAVLEDSAFNAMVQAGGPVTAKGKRRALFDVWDRLDEKLAKRLERIGLERRERNVTDLAKALSGEAQ